MEKSKAQRIVDDIMGTDRFAQVFSDRVFSDEPILRTGASAFRNRPKDPDKDARRPNGGQGSSPSHRQGRASTAGVRTGADRLVTTKAPATAGHQHKSESHPRAAKGGVVYPGAYNLWLELDDENDDKVVPEPQGVRLPPELRSMVRMGSRSLYGRGTAVDAKLFYDQAKLVEDFTVSYEGTGAPLVASSLVPLYSSLSDYQLLRYFDFRTRFRAGCEPQVPVVFCEILALELCELIGAKDATEAYGQLCRLRAAYGSLSEGFNANIRRWIHDFVLFWGLDPQLAGESPTSSRYKAASRVLAAEKALLTLKVCQWPHVGEPLPATLPDATDLLDALSELSRYRAEKSRFFKERREEAAAITCRVFALMVDHCHKRRKIDYVEGLLGQASYVNYRVFPNIPFYAPKTHQDAEIKVGEERYLCQRGFWYRLLPIKTGETSKELGNLLHTIDAKMRAAAGYPHVLKDRSIPKFQAKFIDQEIEAFITERAAIEAATIRIDRFALDGIRSSSVRTREALLTDEERGEDTASYGRVPELEVEGAAEPDGAPVAADGDRDAQEASPLETQEPAGPKVDLGLTERQAALVRRLLAGEVVGEDAGAFLSLEIDAINEAFLEIVGDTVVEFSETGYTLVEDYADEVAAAFE